MGRPRLTIAAVLLVLAALAATMTYTGYQVVGVLAEQAGTSRFVAGLLLGILFARFPWVSNGKPRIVGLLPKPLRRPLIATLLVSQTSPRPAVARPRSHCSASGPRWLRYRPKRPS